MNNGDMLSHEDINLGLHCCLSEIAVRRFHDECYQKFQVNQLDVQRLSDIEA